METLVKPLYSHLTVGAPGDDDESVLSTGSVLLIIFFVFASLYLIVGVLTKKYYRGAEGLEMIPNYDFWVDLPYLCRDGAFFLLGGCQPPATYESI